MAVMHPENLAMLQASLRAYQEASEALRRDGWERLTVFPLHSGLREVFRKGDAVVWLRSGERRTDWHVEPLSFDAPEMETVAWPMSPWKPRISLSSYLRSLLPSAS